MRVSSDPAYAPRRVAATYHVSPSGNNENLGNLAAPWATITKANTVLVVGDNFRIDVASVIRSKVETVHGA